jgi:hypothetical protein
MKNFWSAEPTLILAFVSAGTALAMGFGLNITKEQAALIQTFVITMLALINRSQVTSPQTLQAMTPQTLKEAQATSKPAQEVVKKLP